MALVVAEGPVAMPVVAGYLAAGGGHRANLLGAIIASICVCGM